MNASTLNTFVLLFLNYVYQMQKKSVSTKRKKCFFFLLRPNQNENRCLLMNCLRKSVILHKKHIKQPSVMGEI